MVRRGRRKAKHMRRGFLLCTAMITVGALSSACGSGSDGFDSLEPTATAQLPVLGDPTSSRPEVGLLSYGNGCTATLISNGTFLTAGRCFGFAPFVPRALAGTLTIA